MENNYQPDLFNHIYRFNFTKFDLQNTLNLICNYNIFCDVKF